MITVPVALARSHRWWHLGLGAVLVVAGAVLLPADPIDVPLRGGVRGEAWPAVLALLGAALPAALSSPGAALAAALPRRPWQLRAATAVVIALTAIVVATVACALIDRPVDAGLRNTALSVALAAGSATLFGVQTSWIAPVLVTGATWLYGLDERSAPLAWAVLLRPPSTGSLTVAVMALLTTLTVWVWRGEQTAAHW